MRIWPPRRRKGVGPDRAEATIDWLLPLLLTPLAAIVAVVDARSGRIPDAANAAILLLGAVRALLDSPERLGARLLDALVVTLLLLLVRDLYRRRRGRHGLGLGDVKFLGAATVWTGLDTLPLLLFAASAAALVAVGAQRLAGTRVEWSTRLRFGPYLAIALLACVFLAPSL